MKKLIHNVINVYFRYFYKNRAKVLDTCLILCEYKNGPFTLESNTIANNELELKKWMLLNKRFPEIMIKSENRLYREFFHN